MNLRRLLATDAPRATAIVRCAVGLVFLSEGIQKFLYPATVGAGRFAKIGLPSPELLAPFVGTVEMVCGALVVIGLALRLAAVPLAIVMAVAVATTKVPMLRADGFWKTAHEGRTDFLMIAGLLFLFVAGAGAWSFDARLGRGGRSR